MTFFMPTISVATGFSMNTCLLFSTAYIKCCGRKPGGVVKITTSAKSIAFLYASNPIKIVSFNTDSCSESPYFSISESKHDCA